MTLVEVSVGRLFGQFDHRIVLNAKDRVTIIIAPNGFGKTMILRMIDSLFNGQLGRLAKMPFHELSVRFDNQWTLRVTRTTHAQETSSKTPPDVEVVIDMAGRKERFVLKEISSEQFPYPLSAIEQWIPELERIEPQLWLHLETGEILDFQDVVERHGQEFPADAPVETGIPDWFRDLQQGVSIRFVDVERLTSPPLPEYGFRTSRRRRGPAQRTVNLYSRELAGRIQRTLAEYGSLSQSLDRTFPTRLVSQRSQSDFTMGKLRDELEEVEKKRSQLAEAGLLKQDYEGLEVPTREIEEVDESKREVLAMFAHDTRKKLSVFDDILARVETLKRIANARFLHKQVAVSENGIVVTGTSGQPLELEMLSSGEQHELVLLYGLLFRVSEDALIMIDEPELSLHVAWQDEFLTDIDDIARVSNFRVLLATHSPQIIGDRYDLTIELGGPVALAE